MYHLNPFSVCCSFVFPYNTFVSRHTLILFSNPTKVIIMIRIYLQKFQPSKLSEELFPYILEKYEIFLFLGMDYAICHIVTTMREDFSLTTSSFLELVFQLIQNGLCLIINLSKRVIFPTLFFCKSVRSISIRQSVNICLFASKIKKQSFKRKKP